MTVQINQRGLAAACGLGALAMLPAWDAVLSLPFPARGWIPLAWVVGATLVLTTMVLVCQLIRRPARVWVSIAVGAILVALLFETLNFLYVDLKNTLAVFAGTSYRLGRNLVAATIVLSACGLLWHVRRKGISRVLTLVVDGLALLAALPIVLIASYLLSDTAPIHDELPLPAKRVVVALILDELDRSAIDADIANLPNFASVRGRSLTANNMFPPANYTSESMPGIITGESFSEASYSRRDVHVLPEDTTDWVSLSRRGTLFKDANRIGARTALIGWHLPYCTIIREVQSCWDDAAYAAPGVSVSLPVWLLGHSRLVSVIENQWIKIKKTAVREYSLAFMSNFRNYRLHRIGEIYAMQRNLLLQKLEERRNELVFAHLACPHAPSLDRALVAKLDMYEAYTTNLRKCDQLLGDVLNILERNRYENGWALVVTSDHWFRGRDWLDAGQPNITPAVRRTVPFYLLASSEKDSKATNVLTNSRVLRKLLIGALSPGFSLDEAMSIIDSNGDSLTVMRQF